MTAAELIAKLSGVPGDRPVRVMCSWQGDTPVDEEFRIAEVDIEGLDPDTAEDVVELLCDQDFSEEVANDRR